MQTEAIEKSKNKSILNEEIILKRYKVDNLNKIKKLNLWGLKLTDIQILKDMPQLEVVSLSANCISKIECLSQCKSLSELYLRKNKIKELKDLLILKNLPQLRILWVGDNPCCDELIDEAVSPDDEIAHENVYRAFIIYNLPQIQILDNKEITEHERAEATVLMKSLNSKMDMKTKYRELLEDTDDNLSTLATDEDRVSSMSQVSYSSDSFLPISIKEYDFMKYTSLVDDKEVTLRPLTDAVDESFLLESIVTEAVSDPVKKNAFKTESCTGNQGDNSCEDATFKAIATAPVARECGCSEAIANSVIQLISLLDSRQLNSVKTIIENRLDSLNIQ